jgi:hypothetical protein
MEVWGVEDVFFYEVIIILSRRNSNIKELQQHEEKMPRCLFMYTLFSGLCFVCFVCT